MPGSAGTRPAGRILLWLAAALVVAQLVQLGTPDPPVSRDVGAPPEVESALRRGCYACHSNETRWPWYSRIAPVSWLVYSDVVRGRRHLNFSIWDQYSGDPGTVVQKLKHLRKVMARHEMPPWYYGIMHPRARLSAADEERTARWAEAGIAKVGEDAEPAPR